MISTVLLVSSFVAGLARTELEATQAATTTGISDEEWWEAHSEHLVAARVADRHPLLAAAGEAGAWESGATAESFEFGLERILDGIAALIESRRRVRPVPVEGPGRPGGRS